MTRLRTRSERAVLASAREAKTRSPARSGFEGGPEALRPGWKEDLPKLLFFNRKLMYFDGGFTVLTIVALGAPTFLLHEMLHGERVATALAVFIAVYRTARIGVDFLYYEYRGWPTERRFVIGDLLLTRLFCALAVTCWAVLILRLFR